MDHSRAPVLEALQQFRARHEHRFGAPGHRQGPGADPRVVDVVGAGVFASDVLALNGLDDRRESRGVIEHAQELMADAVHADHTFFSTCGSSLSVKSAMISVAGPGEKLLVSRNAHKSVVAGVIISGVEPVWVHPTFDADRGLAHPPEPDAVRRAIEAHPDAKGLLLITPTDWGSCADIETIATMCHDADMTLIVDEAWGAHLPFHPGLPAWGMDTGADLVVTSVHKMGAAVEQSSIFQLQGDRVDPAVLKAREDLLGTTSSTSLVFATLDGWRRHMVEQGQQLLSDAMVRTARARVAIHDIDGLELMGREAVGPGLAHDLDPLALTIDVRGLGITGYQATEWLRSEHHIAMAAADACRTLARITHGDTDESLDALVGALRLLPAAAQHMPASVPKLPAARGLELETVMLPRDAFFGPVDVVPISDAVGRVAAEMASPYPPGVPVLAPGELIDAEAVDYLRSGMSAGMHVPDTADPSLGTIRVVACEGGGGRA